MESAVISDRPFHFGRDDRPAIRHTQYAVRYTIYALVPAAVPARVVAGGPRITVGAVPVYRRARYDYWAVAVAAVAAVVLVGKVAACDGDCDYCEYDCRY